MKTLLSLSTEFLLAIAAPLEDEHQSSLLRLCQSCRHLYQALRPCLFHNVAFFRSNSHLQANVDVSLAPFYSFAWTVLSRPDLAHCVRSLKLPSLIQREDWSPTAVKVSDKWKRPESWPSTEEAQTALTSKIRSYVPPEMVDEALEAICTHGRHDLIALLVLGALPSLERLDMGALGWRTMRISCKMYSDIIPSLTRLRVISLVGEDSPSYTAMVTFSFNLSITQYFLALPAIHTVTLSSIYAAFEDGTTPYLQGHFVPSLPATKSYKSIRKVAVHQEAVLGGAGHFGDFLEMCVGLNSLELVLDEGAYCWNGAIVKDNFEAALYTRADTLEVLILCRVPDDSDEWDPVGETRLDLRPMTVLKRLQLHESWLNIAFIGPDEEDLGGPLPEDTTYVSRNLTHILPDSLEHLEINGLSDSLDHEDEFFDTHIARALTLVFQQRAQSEAVNNVKSVTLVRDDDEYAMEPFEEFFDLAHGLGIKVKVFNDEETASGRVMKEWCPDEENKADGLRRLVALHPGVDSREIQNLNFTPR